MRSGTKLAWDTAKPWQPTGTAALAGAVSRLRRHDVLSLFVVLVKAATSGDWETFVFAMEKASRVKGVLGLLGDRSALSMVYDQAGLPAYLRPLFVTAVTLSWNASQQIKGTEPSRRLRIVLLTKIFDRPEIKLLAIPEDIKTALYA